MCSAFSENDINTTLLVTASKDSKKNFSNLKNKIWNFYGVKNRFSIEWLNFIYPNIRFKHFFHGLFVTFYLRRNNYSIIYTRSEWVAIFSSILIKKKTILELHNFKNTLSQKIIIRLSLSNAFISLVCISNALKNELIKYGFNKNILVAHDAVDLDLFNVNVDANQIKKKYDLNMTKPIITHIGSIRKGRGFNTIINAAKDMKEFLFVFVCGHSADIEIINKQKDKKLSNVKFIDFLANAEIPSILKISDALLMTYSSNLDTLRFTSPLKMFEYMASGKPLISSDYPVLREILNEKNSLLIESSNSNVLQNAIIKIIDDKEFSNSISIQALKDVKNYTWSNRAKKIIKFMQTSN